MQTEEKTASAASGFVRAETLNAQRRIGSTVYEVETYVKNRAGETAEEKIMRLIKNDLHHAPGHVNTDMTQTGRLPERDSFIP